ncbi:chloramphenicol acetyltransferase [Bacteroides sp. CAG:702]|nr:chloramphenicol acetyltransferase [Bacteroides sp. CAG:702]
MKVLIEKRFPSLYHILKAIYCFYLHYRCLKFIHKKETTQIEYPFLCTRPQNVFLDEFVRINPGAKFIIASGKLIVKKYSEIAYGSTIVTGNHVPTVGIPQYVLGHTHINDKEQDTIIEEDVWVGANVTLLCGAHLGRGCIVGACSLVNKNIPPYAVVGGIPARIISSKFTLEQILKHEEKLYPEQERLSRSYLEELFATYYVGMRSMGKDS